MKHPVQQRKIAHLRETSRPVQQRKIAHLRETSRETMEEIVEGLNRNQQNVLALQQNHKLSS